MKTAAKSYSPSRHSGPSWRAGSYTGAGSGDYNWFELLFLSFTTLSNTGLSDIAPTLGHARAVAIVEEVTGVFYIGLVIARLVGLTLKSGTARN